jgi:tRNA threonylcarbamoyladenosine biosynthesis protein TsaE
MEIDLPDLDALDQLAARIARHLRPGEAVLLDGALGAGKTALARAIIRTLCGDPALFVPSPSYTLVQRYDTPAGTVHHFDLWRLGDPASILELGWDEAVADIVMVEWPDRLGALTPARAWRIGLLVGAGDMRHASITEPPPLPGCASIVPPL